MKDSLMLPLYREAARLQESAKDAEAVLQAARDAISEHGAKMKQEVASMLREGRMKTNLLEAAMFVVFGPLQEVIAKILAWNDLLQASAGDYLLIAVSRNVCFKHVMIPTPGHDNLYSKRYTLWLGKLTGGSLIADVTEDDQVKLTLPMERYVKWESSGEIVRTLEPLKLEPTSSLSAVLGGLTSLGLLMAVAGIDLGHGDNTKVYIGPLAAETLGSIAGKIGSFGEITRYLDAMQVLEEATEAERAYAEGI